MASRVKTTFSETLSKVLGDCCKWETSRGSGLLPWDGKARMMMNKRKSLLLNGNRIGLERSVSGWILPARGTHEHGDPTTWASLVNCFGLSLTPTHTPTGRHLFIRKCSFWKLKKKVLKKIDQRKKLLMDWLTLGFSPSPFQACRAAAKEKKKKRPIESGGIVIN